MFSQKQWMTIAVGGVISALLYALVTVVALGGVLLAYFCQLPLFIIGLSLGDGKHHSGYRWRPQVSLQSAAS